MQIRFAHLKERSNSGGWINFAVFAADAVTSNARDQLLAQLVAQARQQLRIDKAALAFQESGRITYYGTPDLVDYLSKTGVSQWTHTLTL